MFARDLDFQVLFKASPEVLLVLLPDAPRFTMVAHVVKREVTSQFQNATNDVDWRIAPLPRDNGVGFDAENAKDLFGVFQRYHCADEFEGTGATFFFTLPRSRQETDSPDSL